MLTHIIKTSHCTQTTPSFRAERATSSNSGTRLSSLQEFPRLKTHQKAMTKKFTITELIHPSRDTTENNSLAGQINAIREKKRKMKNEEDMAKEKVQKYKNITEKALWWWKQYFFNKLRTSHKMKSLFCYLYNI